MHRVRRPLRAPAVVDERAARSSDPRRTPWGANATLRGRPPAILILAPHKTGSTFFTAFMHDVASLLGLCWYTDNAAFMYAPSDHNKCASPSCGHAGVQRRFGGADRGWGDCTAFTDGQLRAAAAAAATSSGASDGRAAAAAAPAAEAPAAAAALPLSACNGFLWGTLRLPPAMRSAAALLGTGPWQWYVVLHSRHPGDTLVSGYHSFGWTHPASPSASDAQRRAHAARQAAIRNRTVDEYVVSEAPELRRKYAAYAELMQGAPPGVRLVASKYEELVGHFPRWLAGLLAALQPSYDQPTLYALHRALIARHGRAFAPDGRHKRSVRPGRFAAEVSASAVQELRAAHAGWWTEQLGYSF